jgi:hypothetical protein
MNKNKLYICIVALLAVLATVTYLAYSNSHSLGFTHFYPEYIPGGNSIKAQRMSLYKDKRPNSTELNFRIEDWVYSIAEWKDDDDTIGTAKQDYDNTSAKPTCSVKTSQQKMPYRLCHWIDYGYIDVYQVRFIKKDTFIRAMIPGKLTNKISENDIDKFVDSFKQKSTSDMEIRRPVGFGLIQVL